MIILIHFFRILQEICAFKVAKFLNTVFKTQNEKVSLHKYTKFID